MIDMSAIPFPMVLALCFIGGLGLGYLYFRAVRATADLIVGGGSLWLSIGLIIGRLGVIALGFYLAVQSGALALLATLAGVLCAKALMLRLTERGNT